MSRRVARELVMKYLYQMDINDDYSLDTLPDFLAEEDLSKDDLNFIDISFSTLLNNLKQTDEIIEKHLEGWKLSRIPKVDLAILRISVNEINNVKAVPGTVSINEAVDMAKTYSTAESYRFVNGVLGSYYRHLENQG